MAAGDIILSDGTTITPEDLQKIAAETKKILAAESKELSQYEEVSSLSNLTSLPGIFQSGSTMKLVRVALSVLKGIDGKTVEFSASATAIQWRYVGETEWNTLIDIALLKGAKGDAGEKVVFRKGESGIEWKYESEEDTAYKTLVSMDDIKLKYSDLSEADKAELTKKPILATVNAQSGSTPSGSFASDGEDENGNPKYILNLTVQKGDKGEPPVFEVGSVTTGLPSSEASVELTPNGETPEGNPKYIMDISIPKGEPGQNGEGSGNVYATETGLEAGKTYLFRPSAPNSASGTFVLYEAPDTSQFITNAVNNLVNYYLKAETYSREEINSLLGQMSSISFEVVDSLPASGKSNTIYLVKKDGSENDVHDEYIWVEGKWEIIGSTAITLTKESIENVFTGNIESHTHNSTYEYTEFETDVWDGSTISESLQGTGTKDDPYLIQSCADWLGLWQHIDKFLTKIEVGTTIFSEFPHFAKLNKSLDFNNLSIPLSSPDGIYGGCNVDGCSATISNIILDDKIPETGTEGAGNMNGIAGMNAYCYFHDFNLVNITIKKELNIDSTGGDPTIPFDVFSAGMTGAMMNIYANNYIQSKIILSGTIGKDTYGITVFLGAGYYFVAAMPDLIKNLAIKNAYFGASFTVEDNTIKNNDASITINTGISQFIDDSTITGYFNIPSTLLNMVDNNPVFEEGSKTNVYAVANCSNCGNIFNCSDRSKGYVYSNLGSGGLFIDTQNKTLEELNSDSFINTTLNSLELVFRKGTETPVLAPKNAKLKYDGYVRQSEFIKLKEEVRNNAGQGGSTTADYSPYILSKELFDLIDKLPNSSTSEQISAAIGGLEGLQAVIKAAKDNRRIIIKGSIVTGVAEGSFVELSSCLFTESDTSIGFVSTMVVQAGIAWVHYAFGISYEKSTEEFTMYTSINNINPN